MVRITFINNQGEGFAQRERVEDGTTVRELFRDKFGYDADAADFEIKVNDAHVAGNYELRRNDRVSMIRREGDARRDRPQPQRNTIQVVFVNNAGGGFADRMRIDDDLTIEEFLEDEGIDPDQTVVQVNGSHVEADRVLRNGDRISATPAKIDGAAVRVRLVKNDGTGFADRVTVRDNTTAEEFFRQQGCREDSHNMRINGANEARDYVLQDNDRVSITPLKIEGAL